MKDLTPEAMLVHPRDAGWKGICPSCGESVHGVLPIEPVYDLATAGALIPQKRTALVSFLSNHRADLGMPLYRKDRRHNLHRYLTAADIKYIRDTLYRTRNPHGKGTVRLIDLYQPTGTTNPAHPPIVDFSEPLT